MRDVVIDLGTLPSTLLEVIMPDHVPLREAGNTLRLTQTYEGKDVFRVEVELEGSELFSQTAVARFAFKLARQEQEDLRWYFEDYLLNPLDPAPTIAARIENRLNVLGEKLFLAVFASSAETQNIWATLHDRLSDTRIEVASGIGESSAIPWELLKEPQSHTPLALRARTFVRTRTSQAPSLRPHPYFTRHLSPYQCRSSAFPLGCYPRRPGLEWQR